jgi:hypothetical protein
VGVEVKEHRQVQVRTPPMNNFYNRLTHAKYDSDAQKFTCHDSPAIGHGSRYTKGDVSCDWADKQSIQSRYSVQEVGRLGLRIPPEYGIRPSVEMEGEPS